MTLNSTTTTRSLVVPANSLSAGDNYTVALIGMYSPLLNNTASVIIAVPHSQLVAAISGGSTRTIAFSQPLVLNATGSYDPDTPRRQITVVWSCVFASGGACTDKSSNSLSLATGYVLTFPATSLKVNSTCIHILLIFFMFIYFENVQMYLPQQCLTTLDRLKQQFKFMLQVAIHQL